jgi:hypothetical protein
MKQIHTCWRTPVRYPDRIGSQRIGRSLPVPLRSSSVACRILNSSWQQRNGTLPAVWRIQPCQESFIIASYWETWRGITIFPFNTIIRIEAPNLLSPTKHHSIAPLILMWKRINCTQNGHILLMP